MTRRHSAIGPILACAAAAAAGSGCARSDVYNDVWEPPPDEPSPESCDGLDNDFDGLVDEDFRDDAGAYVHDEHCGSCGNQCVADEVTAIAGCIEGPHGPSCGAIECIEGYVVTRTHACVPWDGYLCRPCLEDWECGDFDGARCDEVAGEPRCVVECAGGECPGGYSCGGEDLCLPPSGSCQCVPGETFTMACEIPTGGEDVCYGTAVCDDGILSECAGSDEICDGVDNDCNGVTDDPYVGPQGYYDIDIHNCGGCGIDCTVNPLPVGDLTCGGPATDPQCAMLCVDTEDGLHVGDHVDADLSVATGCECTITSLDDEPGPPLGTVEETDPNCDGADGVVEESYYVSPWGDDDGPGSPLHPMRTIGAAVEAAFASLDTASPRPHVFVAAGAYAEAIELREGVRIHGGYSPDFLTLDPLSYVADVHAPVWTEAFGGAAVVAEAVGLSAETLLEGAQITGASAPSPGRPAFGVYIEGSGGGLRIEGCVVQAGDGADGVDGADGEAGASPAGSGEAGDLPRAAEEGPGHNCLGTADNTVQGGEAAPFSCGSTNVAGGDGGDAECPGDTGSFQMDGHDGHGTYSAPGGDGGSGGWDARAPMYSSEGCPYAVCCDLADFLVPGEYEVAGDGEPGTAGAGGDAGYGCGDPLGQISGGGEWSPAAAGGGSEGQPGSGGGGGGAGGGALVQWQSQCAWPDGLGGGGGSGGAGGCGGTGGQPGTSGSPSVGVLVFMDVPGPQPSSAPVLRDLVIRTGQPGRGGRGGVGGDGGQGAPGGPGGEIEPEDKTTPTLSGTTSGGHGGHGGAGGRGGGGGGGCGGSSVGIWFETGSVWYPMAAGLYESENLFDLSSGGDGGSGGGGGVAGEDGEDGEETDVAEM